MFCQQGIIILQKFARLSTFPIFWRIFKIIILKVKKTWSNLAYSAQLRSILRLSGHPKRILNWAWDFLKTVWHVCANYNWSLKPITYQIFEVMARFLRHASEFSEFKSSSELLKRSSSITIWRPGMSVPGLRWNWKKSIRLEKEFLKSILMEKNDEIDFTGKKLMK